MKKYALFFALYFSLYPLLLSQEYKGKGRVIGYVVDEKEKPLEGVKVKLFSLKANQGFEVVTDKEGRWLASWIRSGGWNLDFEKAGYQPKKLLIQVQEYSRNPEVRVVLKEAAGVFLSDELKEALGRGNSLFDQKKYEEAALVYEEIINSFPDAYVIGINLGNCYFALEKYDEAESRYLKVLEKDAGNDEALLLVGNCWFNRGDKEKALEWYGKINFEKINDPIVLFNIGTIFYNASKFDDALKYYQKAVLVQKDFPDGLYQLGLTYLVTGKYAESKGIFESYLQLDPDSERAGQVRGFLEFLKKSRG